MQLSPMRKPFISRMRMPGDKSITHRAILFSTLMRGTSEVQGWLRAGDTEASLRVAQAFGTKVREQSGDRLILEGAGGIMAWTEPRQPIDCGNSGTTTRLATGLATGRRGYLTVLYGDESLSQRPMARVTGPLADLGASVWTRQGGLAPIAIKGGGVSGGTVHLKVASAQVKSSLLLAGLLGGGSLTVGEPIATRDHTERMLTAMGSNMVTQPEVAGFRITVDPHPEAFPAVDVKVPGDPSSGAFWATLAALLPGSRLVLESVSLNPGRLGFYRLLQAMGAAIEFQERGRDPEPWGDILIAHGALRAVDVVRQQVPAMIDELPLVALLASQAKGVTTVTGAEELRVKESDRIKTTMEGLVRMGSQIEELPDGLRVHGPTSLRGTVVNAHRDHRIAMMLTIASAVAEGSTELEGGEAVAISYPAFFETYGTIAK